MLNQQRLEVVEGGLERLEEARVKALVMLKRVDDCWAVGARLSLLERELKTMVGLGLLLMRLPEVEGCGDAVDVVLRCLGLDDVMRKDSRAS